MSHAIDPMRDESGTGGAGRRRGRPPGRGSHDGLAAELSALTDRLEEAGRVLLALPQRGYSPALRQSRIDVVQSAMEAYGWTPGRIRPAAPDAASISRMDEAMTWLQLIPQDRYVLRRIVGARSLVCPISLRHLYSWRRLAVALRADHKAVQRWHGEGLRLICAALPAGSLRVAEGGGK